MKKQNEELLEGFKEALEEFKSLYYAGDEGKLNEFSPTLRKYHDVMVEKFGEKATKHLETTILEGVSDVSE